MRLPIAACGILALVACGGDDGSPPSSPSPSGNSAPTITSGGSPQIAENDRDAYQTQATDADGDTLTYTISGGADAGLFAISGSGALTFNAAPNFELPTDANQDNVYRVNVTVSDGQASDTVNLSVTVTNDREGIAVRRIATGYDQPTYLAEMPDGRFFVIEKGGGIHILEPSTGQSFLFRTLTDISTDGEGGLLGIATHPDFASNNLYYVFVTNQAGDIEIRQLLGADRGIFLPCTIPHPRFDNHYGGWLDFGPDGFLYIATGDGGGSGDPDDNAQDPNSLLGKILRVSVLTDPYAGASVTYANQPFCRPAPGNPFAAGGGAPEIFALGLRNPFRAHFSGDDLFIGDVGQNSFEEVDRLSSIDGGGTNFGWPFREGGAAFRGNAPAGLTDPVTEYVNGTGPREGASVIGGVVYDGPIADLFGKYVFADFISGNIWSIPVGRLDGSAIAPSSGYELRNADFAPDAGTIDRIVAIVASEDGDIYIVDFDGDIFVVEEA